MKNVSILISLMVVLVLSSCTTSKWGNFNRQKFTNLKTIKKERKEDLASNEVVNLDVEETFTIDEILFQDIEKKDSIQLALVSESFVELLKPIYKKEANTSERDKANKPRTKRDSIIRAIELNYSFEVEVNGGYYYLENPSLDTNSNILTGELVSINQSKKNTDNIMALSIGEYDIYQMNTLMADIDETTITSTNSELKFESPVEEELTTIDNPNDSTVNQKNNTAENISEYHKKEAHNFLIKGLVSLGILLLSILVTPFLIYGFIAIGIILIVVSLLLAYIFFIRSAIHSRKNKLKKRSKDQTTSDSDKTTSFFAWFLLFLISIPLLLIPFLISTIIILTAGGSKKNTYSQH